MSAWRRLSLPGQLILTVALSLAIAQGINFALLIRGAHQVAIARTVEPAAERLLFLSDYEPRDEGRLGRRLRERFVHSAAPPPISPGSRRLPAVEMAVAERLADAGRPAEEVLAIESPRRRNRPDFGDERGVRFTVSARFAEDGRWTTTRARPLPPMSYLTGRLAFETLVIFALTLVPLLLFARHASRSLARLGHAAKSFGQSGESVPVEPTGPSDVRGLIADFNEMQARISALVTEKDVMLGAIGHDLRTPLAALRIRVEAVDDADEREEMVAVIETMHRDLEDILFLARLERGEARREAVGLRVLAEAVAAEHQGGVAVAAGPEVEVRAQPAALRRAVRNLVENAVKYAGTAEISVEKAASGARIAVRDRGPGMAEGDLETAVQPFVRLEGSRNRDTGGSGLGLAIVKRVAERHGGTLVLRNRDGGGLEAAIQLP